MRESSHSGGAYRWNMIPHDLRLRRAQWSLDVDECGQVRLSVGSPREAPAGLAGQVLEDHAFGCELVADAVGLGEVLGLAGRGAQTRSGAPPRLRRCRTCRSPSARSRGRAGGEPRRLPPASSWALSSRRSSPSALALAARLSANSSANRLRRVQIVFERETRAPAWRFRDQDSSGPGRSDSVR